MVRCQLPFGGPRTVKPPCLGQRGLLGRSGRHRVFFSGTWHPSRHVRSMKEDLGPLFLSTSFVSDGISPSFRHLWTSPVASWTSWPRCLPRVIMMVLLTRIFSRLVVRMWWFPRVPVIWLRLPCIGLLRNVGALAALICFDTPSCSTQPRVPIRRHPIRRSRLCRRGS